LVKQELGWRDGEVFNLLADPDLVQSGAAECQCRDDDTEELGLGCLVDGKGNANACREDCSQHVSCNLLSEEDEVDKDDGGRGHDLGQLVETDRVEGQAKVAKHNVSGEEAADGQHVPDIQPYGLKSVERSEGRDEEDEAGGCKMPHDDHELASFELLVAEDSMRLSAGSPLALLHVAYRLLRKIKPSVESVLSAIQKHVISFSLSGTGEGSTVKGFSKVGSSSSSWDSRGSTLSTRPSIEGRFSTVCLSVPDVFHLWPVSRV
jgi:hypothetical protein